MIKKITAVLLVIIIVVGSVLYHNRAIIVRNYVVETMQHILGVSVDVRKVRVNLPQGKITLSDVIFHNPPGFREGNMMKFSSIMIDYNKDALKEGTIHISLLDLEIEEIVVVKDENGKYNLDALDMETTVTPIDQFELSIKRVAYLDESKKGPMKLQVFDVNIKDQRYKDIPGPEVVVDVIIREAVGQAVLKGAAISGMLVVGGAAFWPVGAALVVVGKNTATAEFDIPADVAFKSAKETVSETAKIETMNEKKRSLGFSMQDYSFSVKIKEISENKCEVRVSARRLRLLPSLAAAKTGLYAIADGFGDMKSD